MAAHVVNSNGNNGVVATLKPFVPAASAIVALIAFFGATFQYMRIEKARESCELRRESRSQPTSLLHFRATRTLGLDRSSQPFGIFENSWRSRQTRRN